MDIEQIATPMVPPWNVVGSPAPQAVVVSLEIGATMKSAGMMLGSATAAGVRLGATGGLEPPLRAPQLNRPPGPLRLAEPAGAGAGRVAPPQVPQSTPAAPAR